MADTIKEFLVGLAFKVDEKTLKTFTAEIDNATKAVTNLASRVSGTALAIAAGVSAYASSLEELYFASNKANSTAEGMRALEKTAQGLGASASEATSSVQALARYMRTNPGGESYIQSIGGQTRDANGELLKTEEILKSLGIAFRGRDKFIAQQQSGYLGINEDVFRAITSGEFGRRLEENKKKYENSGLTKATQDAHRFMDQLRELQIYLESFAVKVSDALMRVLGGDMDKFAVWFEKNGPLIAQRTAEIAVAFVKFSGIVGGAIVWVVDKLIELDKATDGWSTKIIALIAVVNLLGGASLIGGIISLASAFAKLGLSINGAGIFAAIGKLGIVAAAGYGGWKIGEEISKSLSIETNDAIGGTIATVLARFGSKEAQDSLNTNIDRGFSLTGKTKPNGTSGDVAAWFQRQGWTKEQSAGLAANLQVESGFNPRAVGDKGKAIGIAQWHPDRQADFERMSGKSLQVASLEEQLAFVQYELTRGRYAGVGRALGQTRGASEAGDLISRRYEIPANGDVEAMRRGQLAAQIAQTTTINVNGGNDAAATAREVAAQQVRVNQDLTRNLRAGVF